MSLVVAAIVTKAAMAGSGCKATDKVEAKFSEDGAELILDFPAFSTKKRANCEIVLTIAHPAGVRMAPKSGRFNWSGELGAGGAAELALKYHYQGASETAAGRLSVKAPGKIAARDDVVAIDRPEPSKCGEKVTSLVIGVSALVLGTGAIEVAHASPIAVDWSACP